MGSLGTVLLRGDPHEGATHRFASDGIHHQPHLLLVVVGGEAVVGGKPIPRFIALAALPDDHTHNVRVPITDCRRNTMIRGENAMRRRGRIGRRIREIGVEVNRRCARIAGNLRRFTFGGGIGGGGALFACSINP